MESVLALKESHKKRWFLFFLWMLSCPDVTARTAAATYSQLRVKPAPYQLSRDA